MYKDDRTNLNITSDLAITADSTNILQTNIGVSTVGVGLGRVHSLHLCLKRKLKELLSLRLVLVKWT